METLFCCPLCASPLERTEHNYRCPNNHSFDKASAGYVHLLPPNKKHSANPGDDKEMVAARAAFLEKGHYAPLRDALCSAALRELKDIPAPALLDSGCGEGYYTTGLFQSLKEAGHTPYIAGIDISKFAVRRAAKKLPDGEFAVASVYRLPVADSSIDLLTNVFSPLAVDEFARVLKPGGVFCYVVPSARHLWEMKEILYPSPYENPIKRDDYTGFVWERTEQIRYSIHMDDPADIMALFGMTPYAWKTPKEGIVRLSSLQALDTQIGFDIHIYRKENG